MFRPFLRQSGGKDTSRLAGSLTEAVRGVEAKVGVLADSILHGDRLSGFPGRGLEAVGVREYQHGDEARGIDWRVTARKGSLHVREFDEERDLPFLIVLHRSATLSGGRSGIKEVRALELAGLLTALSLRSGDRVGILQGGEERDLHNLPGRGKHRLQNLLALLLSPPDAAWEESLTQLMTYAHKRLTERSRVFLIGDFLLRPRELPSVRRGLLALGNRHALTPIRIRDGREGAFSGAWPLPLMDPRTGAMVRPRRGKSGELREAQDREEEVISSLFRRCGLREWCVNVDDRLVPTLRGFLAGERLGGGIRV